MLRSFAPVMVVITLLLTILRPLGAVTASIPGYFAQLRASRCLDWVSGQWKRLFYRRIRLLDALSPSCLRPEFTWPHLALEESQLASELPEVDLGLWPVPNRVKAILHEGLQAFSRYYCAWFGMPPSLGGESILPFGLQLRHMDHCRMDEVRSMMAVRAAGIPAPKVISICEFPRDPVVKVSILMTRLPGKSLGLVYDDLSVADRERITSEMDTILRTMRSWASPWGGRLCSISGGHLVNRRVSLHVIQPCDTESEFNDRIMKYVSPGYVSLDLYKSEDFQRNLTTAHKMRHITPHKSVFSHGELAERNIMVYNGRVSGLTNWTYAGWYPEYWEYTTSYCKFHWNPADFRDNLRKGRYEEELEVDLAIMYVTCPWL